MSDPLESWKTNETPEPPPLGLTAVPGRMPLLSPYNAWRILEGRTGINVGRSTFYRWVQSGKVFSMKMGGKIYIPWPEIENVIRQFRSGIRL